MKRLTAKEYVDKIDKAVCKLEEATKVYSKAKKDYTFELDLIEIDYNGPDWLETGLVGGWTDDDDDEDWSEL